MVTKRCYGCMQEIQDERICGNCGYDNRRTNAPHQLPQGTVLRNQYLIGHVLGQGGFGITYLGLDMDLDIPVAIKEYYPTGLVSRETSVSHDVTLPEGDGLLKFNENRDRFLREARILARLENISEVVQVKGFFSANNTAYIVMGYVKGITLKEYIRRRGGKITIEETFQLLKPLLKALDSVHKAGLVHRDISPDNIMVTPDGKVRLIDFGAAHAATITGDKSTQAVLKHGFAPPEQYTRRGNLDSWTDVYGICATIYNCLTGRIPPTATERMLGEEEFIWDDIPGLTQQHRHALNQGLELQYSKRTQTMNDLSVQLFAQSTHLNGTIPEISETGTIALKKDDNPPVHTAPIDRPVITAPVILSETPASKMSDSANPIRSNTSTGEAPPKKKKTGIMAAAVLAVMIVIGALCIPFLNNDTRSAETGGNGSVDRITEPNTIGSMPNVPEETVLTTEKVMLNVWSFSDEVPMMVQKYMELNPDFAAKYDIKITIISTTDQLYQPALDQALAAGGADAPDLYCADAAFILKYSQGDAAKYAAPYEDLGIDVAGDIEKAAIAPYSVDIGTRPADGKVVALGYQSTSGVFIYRRSIAKDVWGTDDPAVVAEKIGAGSGNWTKFYEAAAELKNKDYRIISGPGDLWYSVENSADTGWVVDGKLIVDPRREAFLDLSMEMMQNGYYNNSQTWTDAWYDDMGGKGPHQVFGFFGPAWMINYVIAVNCGGDDLGEGTYGDWAVCAPPVGFFSGGTWLLANKDSQHKEAVGEILHWITLNCTADGLQYGWANGTIDWDNDPSTSTDKDSVASVTVMAMSDGEMEILGGQNMFEAFIPANYYANGKCTTEYDPIIASFWCDYASMYATGEMTRGQAINAFKESVSNYLGIKT